MKFARRGLAVLLVALLIMPGSSMLMEGVLRVEAAETDAVLENDGEEIATAESSAEEIEEVDTAQKAAEAIEEGISSSVSEETVDEMVPMEQEKMASVTEETEDEAEELEETEILGEPESPFFYAGKIIANGTDGSINWVIEADGKLTVEGSGELTRGVEGTAPLVWKEYRDKITSAEINVTGMTDLSGLFYGCSNLVSVDLSGLDTSNAVNMQSMFAECHSLTSVDLSNFDTSKVIFMEGMFAECHSLESLNLSNFDTSKVEDMNAMFGRCNSLTSLDLSNFDTGNVIDMNGMFLDCSNLTSLNISSFDTSNVTNLDSMFADCYNLTEIDVSSFNTSKVTNMSCLFGGCTNLKNINLSEFDTNNVTDMGWMFSACKSLTSLDLNSFNVSKVTDMRYFFQLCGNLNTIYTPGNLTVSCELPVLEGYAWYLPDGTETTELPKNLNYSVTLIRRNKEDTGLDFKVTGATGHNRYQDIYIAENNGQDILDTLFDPLYENTYQTLLINDQNADLSNLAPIFEKDPNAAVYAAGQTSQEISGISVQDFSNGEVQYTIVSFDKVRLKNYWITFAKKESGSKLFVNGPEEREIFLTDYFDNKHDILIANVGDAPLTGIKAELLDAENVKLDEAFPADTLAAFTQVPVEGQSGTVMSNLGKVRLVPDGEGEIKGTLKITAAGQDPVYIVLKGYSNNPRIITTTTDMNMDDVIRVKYVPYSYTVETNNEYNWNKVTFTVESGELARGLQMYPSTGEIYGVPLEAGEFTITVKATYSRPEFLPSYAQLKLIVKENTDGNVNVATDSGYDLIQRVQNMFLDSILEVDSQTMVSLGEYDEFLDVYLDGEKLVRGDDYTSESGSTRITILNQTLTRGSVGTHTIGIEFRTRDTNILKRAAQNYLVSDKRGTENVPNVDNSNNESKTVFLMEEETIIYTVVAGDTLWKIAQQYYGSGTYWTKIYADNADTISDPNKIYVGQQIVINLSGGSSVGMNNVDNTSYTVASGDTLWEISKRVYGKGKYWKKIYAANTDIIADPSRIYVGQILVLPED